MFQLLLAVIYLAFISLGLPDSLLGSAWPTMYSQFNVPLSYAGVISMIICLGTIVSSFNSERINLRLGTGRVTAISVCMTALALLGFSISNRFWMLCLWAIPYGLGAGSIDSALNYYVALHYESRHMSWLHCMWGVGASLGPYIMEYAIGGGMNWNGGYRIIGFIQLALTVIMFISLPLWKTGDEAQASVSDSDAQRKPMTLREIFAIPGAKAVLICFFSYCALEQTCGLWAASYFHLYRGVSAEKAAGFAALYYIGITIGRGINGFLSMKLSDKQLLRLGLAIILLGLPVLIIPGSELLPAAGMIIIGLGSAPIYPCVIHSTPAHFGQEKAAALIGIQMAFSYIGILVMPPLFGIVAKNISVGLLPAFLLFYLASMIISHELLVKKTEISK